MTTLACTTGNGGGCTVEYPPHQFGDYLVTASFAGDFAHQPL